MWNIAHRGASGYASESTRAAFDLALAMGATAIETDVRMTSDGGLILFHDATVGRVTNGQGPADDFTLAEIRELVVGDAVGPDLSRQRILTVTELLDEYADRCPLVLEIKDARVTQPLLNLIHERCLTEVTLTSFLWYPLVEARTLAPNLPLGFLTPTFDFDLVQRCRRRGFQQICPHVAQLTAVRVRRAHEHGLTVRAWGIDQRFQIERLFETGVEGATVNWPDWIPAAERDRQA